MRLTPVLYPASVLGRTFRDAMVSSQSNIHCSTVSPRPLASTNPGVTLLLGSRTRRRTSARLIAARVVGRACRSP
jgi:hypothetical protein